MAWNSTQAQVQAVHYNHLKARKLEWSQAPCVRACMFVSGWSYKVTLMYAAPRNLLKAMGLGNPAWPAFKTPSREEGIEKRGEWDCTRKGGDHRSISSIDYLEENNFEHVKNEMKTATVENCYCWKHATAKVTLTLLTWQQRFDACDGKYFQNLFQTGSLWKQLPFCIWRYMPKMADCENRRHIRWLRRWHW